MNLDPRFDYPTHFTVISYTLMPEPPENSIFVEDCVENDRPRQVRRETASFAPEAQNDFCFGIIGGADGPTASLWAKLRRGSFTLRARRCTLRRSTTSTGASASAKLRGKRGRSRLSNYFFCVFRYSVGRTPKALWNSVENLLWLS